MQVNKSLEKYITEFLQLNKLNSSSIYFLYNGTSLPQEQFKKPISEIISKINKKDKIMQLLAYYSEFNINEENEIIIILSIESFKIEQATGKKEETIKNIIKNLIKFDFIWCIFTYKEEEIDIDIKFDDIADDEDKETSKIEITVNYTIPLIVNFTMNKNKKSIIQCLFGNMVSNKIEPFFVQEHLNMEDYNLVYNNKIFDEFYYKSFYVIISEANKELNFDNEHIANTIKSFPINENLNDTNKIKINDKEKIDVLPINKLNERKIEIEIQFILKSFCCRFKIKMSKCCSKFKK